MAKFLKETPVHIACPACARPQRVKLKWALNHKSLKCKDCKKSISLRENPAKGAIERTEKALANFERVLKALRFEAKQARKGKQFKKARATAKRPGSTPKVSARSSMPKAQTASMMPASPAGAQPQA